MMTTFQAAAIISAYEPLAMSLGTTIQGASYLTSAQIIVLGFAPLFWKPVSQRFGRRPVWLISTLCSGLFNIGCALSTTYGSMMVYRCFSAFFIAPPIGIGSGVVVELFLANQRGQKMGIWTLLITLGPPSGPVYHGIHDSICRLGLDLLDSRNRQLRSIHCVSGFRLRNAIPTVE